MYLLADQCKESAEYLSQSMSISPRMVTAINLGDAYRCIGDPATATKMHRWVLEGTTVVAPEYERYFGDDWLYSFMPLTDGDTETIKHHISVRTRQEKLAIAHFALALDYAVSNDISAADIELNKAEQFDGENEHKPFYANKIASLQRSVRLSDPAKQWLAKQRARLDSQ